jgi:hypothetical protein
MQDGKEGFGFSGMRLYQLSGLVVIRDESQIFCEQFSHTKAPRCITAILHTPALQLHFHELNGVSEFLKIPGNHTRQ